MEREIKIEIKEDKLERLEFYADLLNKDINMMLDEALEQYFKSEEKRIATQGIYDESAQTNLDFNEFWDDLDF